MKKAYRFAYGDTFVDLPVEENSIIGELKGKFTPPVSDRDIPAILKRSLDNPVDSLSLRECVKGKQNIVLVVSDITRFWMRQDKVIPHIISYLNCSGISNEKITILVANGTHVSGDEQELRTIVSDEVFNKIRVINHNCVSEDNVFLGTTSFGTQVYVNSLAANADLVICLGACTHHVMAGFGGGRKSILPGICGKETIEHNHLLCLDPVEFKSNPLIGTGVLKNNPVNEDMNEAAGFMKNLFMINLVCNADLQLASVISGHYLSSWLNACDEVNRIYRVPIAEKADVIITSCGGYPKDESLYQGTKVLDNVLPGLNPGGTVIAMMQARNGGGSPDYFDWCKNLTAGDFESELRRRFTVGGYIFFLNCEQARQYNVYLYSDIDEELVKPMGIHVFHETGELMKNVDIEGKKVYIIENGSTVVPYLKEEE